MNRSATPIHYVGSVVGKGTNTGLTTSLGSLTWLGIKS